jgi:hypothetical protein
MPKKTAASKKKAAAPKKTAAASKKKAAASKKKASAHVLTREYEVMKAVIAAKAAKAESALADARSKAEARENSRAGDPKVETEARLAKIRALGASVKVGPPATKEAIAKAEKKLGTTFQPTYRDFLSTFGSIAVERGRTWLFYGVPEKPAQKNEYLAELAPAREALEAEGLDEDLDDPPYFPQRFHILADSGAYGNAASGFVWDADLEHIRYVDGARWMDRSENRGPDYWALLRAQLDDIHSTLTESA